MKQAGELELLLSQTIAATNKPDFYLNISHPEPLKIKFNRHYFVTMKLLVGELTQQYHKEKSAWFVNHKLIKFIEFGQKFLNYYCAQATFYPENLKQYSFELSLFYIAYSNLAHQFKFSDLLAALKNMQTSLFHECKTSALINTDIKDFYVRFSGEVTGYEDYLNAIYDSYVNDEYRKDAVVAYEKLQHFTFDILESNLHVLQRQFCITLLQFHSLNPLLISDKESNLVDKLLHPEAYERELNAEQGINIADELVAPMVKKIDQEHITYLRHEYEKHLKFILYERLQKTINRLVIMPIKVLSETDLQEMQLNFIIFAHLNFSKVKMPKEMGVCLFINCVFIEDNLNNTQFRNCIFYNCNFSWFTIHGAFKSCEFISCYFKAALFEWLDLRNCKFKECSLENTDWYKVDAEGVCIDNTSLVNASIKFSNIKQARLIRVDLTNARFEGTNLKLTSASECNWINTNLDDALFLSDAHRVFREHLLADINVWFVRLFQDPQRCQNMLITSGDITTKLNQIINDEAPLNQIHYKLRFRQLLGWILCATDRLNSYCDLYIKDKNSFIYSISFNVMESLAEITKLAINLLNNRYLTLYDKCHISSMVGNMLNNSIFSYSQYQDIMHKKWAHKKIYLGPYFTNTEKSICPNNDIDNDNTESKFFKRESLVVIQQLPSSLKRLEKLLAEMRNQLQNNQRLIADNPRPGR